MLVAGGFFDVRSRGLAALVFAAIWALGCGGGKLSGATGGNAAGGSVSITGSGGQAPTGAGGAGDVAAPCAGPSDERLVVAGQRIMLLTKSEIVNTVRYLIDDTEARALVDSGMFSITTFVEKHFPPADGEETNINSTSILPLSNLAEHVGGYVTDNFATLAGCATATDACATTYLDKLATRAYRRALTPLEQSRFSGLYNRLRAPQVVNGYDVTFTVEEATGYAVNALLMSPQLLWRWELGEPAMASIAPAGIPLTDDELASHLAFFFTDQPPDDTLRAAAAAGTLRANLSVHVGAFLASKPARDWLRTVVETYFLINQLPAVPIDPAVFPLFTNALVQDMTTEARLFLDEALWNGNLTDLLLSRTTFLNTNLATNIYMVPVPPGATATSFVQTTLPADRRAGLLTNAAWLTSRGRSDGRGVVVPRGNFTQNALVCIPTEVPDLSMPSPEQPVAERTSREQVEYRATVPLCNACHAEFDPYGLALENYDGIGRYRTVDERGLPIDPHATLPASIGGGTVANGVALAEALASKPEFLNCMAAAVLQLAMVELSARVEVPLPPAQAGCATADVVQRYKNGSGKTFSDLVRATTAAPAFVLRRAAP